MEKIVIQGGKELTGSIKISGAKNSAVALIPAAILCDEISTIDNVPEITDRDALIEIIELLNGKVQIENNKMQIDASNLENKVSLVLPRVQI